MALMRCLLVLLFLFFYFGVILHYFEKFCRSSATDVTTFKSWLKFLRANV